MNRRFPLLLPATLLLAVVGLLLVAPAWAQEVAGTGEDEGGETMFSLIRKGGWLMWPIFLCSLVVLTITLERFISLRQLKTTPDGLLQEVFRRLPNRSASRVDREACAEMLARDGSVLSRVLRTGVLRLHRGTKRLEEYLREAVTKEMHLLKRRVRPFSIISSVAPLLGLLGTIYGMIRCFSEAGAAESSQRTQVLADGIYAALVTTAAGLTVAIPALLLYHFFLGRVDRVVDELEESASDVLERYYGDEEAERISAAPSKSAASANSDTSSDGGGAGKPPPREIQAKS